MVYRIASSSGVAIYVVMALDDELMKKMAYVWCLVGVLIIAVCSLCYNYGKQCYKDEMAEKTGAQQKRLLRLLIVLTMLSMTMLSLNGCSTSIQESDFCLMYRPVYVDPLHDTEETMKQVIRNNAVYESYCDN